MAKPLPLYQCHKQVRALKIKRCFPVQNGYVIVEFDDDSFEPLKLSAVIAARGLPEPGDYYVVYNDGYESFSPAKAFEDGYSRIDG